MRELEGVHNFREVAGYPVQGGWVMRPGMLFRAGALDLMSEADAKHLGEELRLRTILDLRHGEEIEMRVAPHALDERVILHSIFPEDSALADVTAELNGLYGAGISFKMFAEAESYPMLVHCTAGKDRTGVLIGMVMEVLGCSPEDIAHEYGLSNAATDRLLAYLVASGRQIEGTEEEIRARLATPADRMSGFLELLRDKHGGAEAFFERSGVPRDEIERVRELLTSKPA
jgi:protein-tyrosine phosphatase